MLDIPPDLPANDHKATTSYIDYCDFAKGLINHAA